MKRVLPLWLLGGAVGLASCQKQPPVPAPSPVLEPPELRLHFAGLERIGGDTNTAKLNQLLGLPTTIALGGQVRGKLAKALPSILFPGAGPSVNREESIRWLIDQVVRREFAFELRSQARDEWTLAISIPAAEAESWRSRIFQAAGLALPPPATALAGFPAWRISPGGGGRPRTVVAAGNWLVLHAGGEAPLSQSWLPAITKSGRPPVAASGVASVELDLARFAAATLLAPSVPWPRLELRVQGQGEDLRAEGRLLFTNARPWRLGPVQLPASSIRDPLISFTVAQGFGDWLQRQPEFKDWEIPPPPNQVTLWAQLDIPYNLLAAAPMPAASRFVTQLVPRALHTVSSNLAARGFGRVEFVTNRQELVWLGLPILAPFVRAAPEAGDNFLLAGTMAGVVPVGPNTNPPPAELAGQVTGRENLAFYNWELTGTKLLQWMPLLQFQGMVQGNALLMGSGVAQAWMRELSGQLGNSITEITAVSPRELHIVRRSQIGFTALELALISRWLDNPDFPAFAYPAAAGPGAPPAPAAPR